MVTANHMAIAEIVAITAYTNTSYSSDITATIVEVQVVELIVVTGNTDKVYQRQGRTQVRDTSATELGRSCKTDNRDAMSAWS